MFAAIDTEKALGDLDKLVFLSPDDAFAYQARGIALADLGRYDDALREFNAAISLDPDDPESYNQRGLVRTKLGDHQGAREDFEQAAQLGARGFIDGAGNLIIVVAPGSMSEKKES